MAPHRRSRRLRVPLKILTARGNESLSASSRDSGRHEVTALRAWLQGTYPAQVPQAWYFAEPEIGRWRRLRVDSSEQVQAVVDEVLAMKTQIGHPTLSIKREDGSLLTLSTDGERGYFVHFTSDGKSRSSVGVAPDGPALVYDYEGHWSEAASISTVPMGTAVQAAQAFVEVGTMDIPGLDFEDD